MTAEPWRQSVEWTEIGRGDGHGPVIDFTRYGVPLIGFLTMEDRDYPVEVARDHAGRLLGARICLTTDVDELEDESGGVVSRFPRFCAVHGPYVPNCRPSTSASPRTAAPWR